MGRLPNDGRGRLGGRTKGTPNKPQTPFTVWVAGLIDKHRGKIEQALAEPWGPGAQNLFAALMVAGAIQGMTPAEEQPNNKE